MVEAFGSGATGGHTGRQEGTADAASSAVASAGPPASWVRADRLLVHPSHATPVRRRVGGSMPTRARVRSAT